MGRGDHGTGVPGLRGQARGGLKRFRCGDVVPGCGAVFTGPEESVFALAGEHAVRDHGVDVTDPVLVAAVRAAIHPL